MTRLALAAGAAALLVALVAAIDHRHKREVQFAAQEDAWFCEHGRPAACRDFDQAAYERRWEQREFGYRAAFFAFGVASLGLGVLVVRRRIEPVRRGRPR